MVQKKLSAERRAVEKQQSEEYSKKAKLYEELVNKTAPVPVAATTTTTTTATTTVAPSVVSMSEFEALKGTVFGFFFFPLPFCVVTSIFFTAELRRLSQRVAVLEQQQQLTRVDPLAPEFWNH